MVTHDGRLAVGLLLLLALSVTVLWLVRVPLRRSVLVAGGRAALQLAVLGVVLKAVFAAPASVGLVLAVMLATASLTAARRLRGLPGAGRAVLLSSLAGALPTLGIVFGTGALEPSARYVVALGGIVLGGTMTACDAGRSPAARRSAQPPGGDRGLARPRGDQPRGPSSTSSAPRSPRRCCPDWTRPAPSGW